MELLIKNIDIHAIPFFQDNYAWTLVNPATRDTIIIDPGDAKPILTFLNEQQLVLSGILITHHHFDHTNGIEELKKHYDVPVFASSIEHVKNATVSLQDHDRVKLDNFPIEFDVITIPGHTLGHIAYYAKGMLFCGDTLFAAGCGRVFEGTMEQMYNTLQKIAALPDDTHIYCGHEYTLKNLHFAEKVEPHNSDIQERIKHVKFLRERNLPSLPSPLAKEKKTNPFLRCDSRELIQQVETYAGKKLTTPVEVFTYLRKWKDTF